MDTTGATDATPSEGVETYGFPDRVAQIPPELLEESDGDYGDVEDEDLTETEAGDDSDSENGDEDSSDSQASSNEDGGSDDSDSSSDVQVRCKPKTLVKLRLLKWSRPGEFAEQHFSERAYAERLWNSPPDWCAE